MIGKQYFARQATMLMRLAKSVKDPELSTQLVAKAADLEEKANQAEQELPLIVPALKDQH